MSDTPILRGLLSGIVPRLARLKERLRRKPQGPEGVDSLGHRLYVGGRWDALGRLQLEFMVGRGLRPEHTFLDVGCGSLRAGVHFIPYLDRGRYLGLEKEARLVHAGVTEELGLEIVEEKRPRFVISSRFAVGLFGQEYDFALANSVFTHLTPELIRLCLAESREFVRPGGAFYASFFESRRAAPNPSEPHDHRNFFYTRADLDRLARDTGWRARYIGHWGHPRGQRMCAFDPA